MGAYDCDCINNLEYDRRERKQKEQSRSTAGQLNDGARSTVQSTDLIDRQQAIDALDTAIEHYDGIAEECRKKADIERNDYMDMRDDAYEARQLAQWLNELKYLREKIEQLTIKPEPQWIPLEEKMPDTNVDILLQFKSNMTVGFYEDGDWAINTGDGIYSMIGDNEEKPIAWMPLPEPYKPNK